MKYALDTEFADSPETERGCAFITLLSVGLVGEDGSQLHIGIERPQWFWETPELEWHRENVLPHMPPTCDPRTAAGVIANFVRPDPEFYAYVGAYDWVAFMALFGPLVGRPDGWPMSYRELKQTMKRYEATVGSYSPDPFGRAGRNDAHSALADARWNMDAMKILGIVMA